ncbi:MAG: RNA-binding transcriptional accessory protein, partial [Firmicutes bacterium HGW-Firmicutes-21]
MDIIAKLAEELRIRYKQAEDTVNLIDEGNTIPFIARYRKEVTGSLDDGILRDLGERLIALRALEERRSEVLRLIDEQGKLTEDIKNSLEKATTLAELDDIYRPYRPKRRTRASIAAVAGLSPLAELMIEQKSGFDIEKEAENYINEEKKIMNSTDALNGAMDIIAEKVSDNAEFRKWIREYTMEKGTLVSSVAKAKKEEDSVYRLYYDYSEAIKKIPSHRLLAINRGEREEFLTVKIDVDKQSVIAFIEGQMLSHRETPSTKYVKAACEDGYDRLIAPSVQNEI